MERIENINRDIEKGKREQGENNEKYKQRKEINGKKGKLKRKQ